MDYTGRQARVMSLSVPDGHTYSLAGGGLGDAVVSPDGSKLYVANKEMHRIECLKVNAPYDTLWRENTESYYSGLLTRPRGIAISPDGNYLFTADQIPGGSKVAMWRISPWAWLAEADIPSNGRRIAVNKDCTRIYVTEHDENRVFVYRLNWSYNPSTFGIAQPENGRDLDTIPGYQASPVGIAVGEWENIGVFRESSGLWALKGVTRAYFGSGSDIPVTR